MAWFYFDHSSAAPWFWCILGCLLLWMTKFVPALGGYIPPALRWRSGHGISRVEPERSETPYPVWWFWRVLSSLGSLMVKFVRVPGGYIPRALRWLRDRGSSRVEPEQNGESSVSLQETPQLSDDETDQEDQHEAVAAKKRAGSVREVDDEQPGWSKGHGDGFDRPEFYRVETTDEFYCDYDSTWETEECEEDPPRRTCRSKAPKSYNFRRFESAARDMQNYRHKYPDQKRSQSWESPVTDTQPNLNFYLGNSPSLPDGVFIDGFHTDWYRSYDRLEHVHTFIQWLFPLPEPGMNYQATPLTQKEVKGFCNSSTAKANLLKSYELMLDFYGIRLRDKKTGEVEKAPNWSDRFSNLNSHTHNSLRITRILKCLGILGFPHYQAPLVRFFLNETLVNGELQNVQESVLNYFLFAVLDKEQRRDLIKFAYKNYRHVNEFVWCPKNIQEMWSRQSESHQGKRKRRLPD